ncbi:MAG: hypothetical protein O3C60_11845, partial [Planctomycetota bacterium]|nr:hypothetical protein [Planctomycetota bacterium]
MEITPIKRPGLWPLRTNDIRNPARWAGLCKRRGFAPKKDIPSVPSTDGNERTRVLPAIGQTDVNVRFRKLWEVDISATAPSKGGHSEAVKEIS